MIMKPIKCLCGTMTKEFTETKEGVKIYGGKCPKCGEIYWSGGEMLRWEILTGRRKLSRKVGIVGDSYVIRIPKKIVEESKIKLGDYALFEQAKNGILIKIVH